MNETSRNKQLGCFVYIYKLFINGMKNLFVLFFLVLIALTHIKAQDILTLRSGDQLNGKIVRINQKDIIFIPRGVTDTTIILRDVIEKAKYQNGNLVIFTSPDYLISSPGTGFDSAYYIGISDAEKYYIGYKGASTGTLISALAFPFNIIPAIACSATEPQDQNLGIPNSSLRHNPVYYNGYKNEAHRIKKHKVWQNYAIGSGAILGFFILVSAITAASVY
jgi:hypothetical protein